MEEKRIDLLIEHGTILTICSDMRIIERGWLAVNDGFIIALEEGDFDQKENGYQPINRINAEQKIVMPGFINTHTHIPMSYFKGLADDLPLFTWLNNHIWPQERKMVSKEFVYNASLHGIAELIRNGVTMFNDQYFHGEQTAEAAIQAGIRAVIGEGIIDFPVADYQNSQQIIDYTMRLHNKYQGNGLIDVSISPHAIYTCSQENLEKVIRLANEHDLLVHTHLAETKKEFNDALEKYKKTPTDFLNDLGFWSHKVTAAHCVWLTDSDIEILAENRVNIALNIESNLKLASGFMPLRKCVEQGINISIGTDGVASNNNLSIIEEMSLTAKVFKAINDDPTFMPAANLVRCATYNGAVALGKENFCGTIEIGKKADIITVDFSSVESQPMYDPFSQLVYNLSSHNIKDVVIDGKPVMINRNLITLDEDEILGRAKHYKRIIQS